MEPSSVSGAITYNTYSATDNFLSASSGQVLLGLLGFSGFLNQYEGVNTVGVDIDFTSI